MLRPSSPLVPIAAVLALLGGVAFLWTRQVPVPPQPALLTETATPVREKPAATKRTARAPRLSADDELLADLAARLAGTGARADEVVLTFKDAAALRAFLARAAGRGITVLGSLERLGVARVRFDSLEDLRRELAEYGADFAELDANLIMQLPAPPAVESRAATQLVPLGANLLKFLGVTGDHSTWGRGVTIAIIDTGVVADATFGNGRLRALDLGFGLTGTTADDGHGTAVAALAAGAAADAQGVASAANLLSLRVTGADGLSDVFTVAQALLAAVDAGAQIVNVSLGSYSSSSVLSAAIAYATERGVVIVASAGNDHAAQLTWPAADRRVVSVAAVDALGQQATFSNSGAQLQIAAPGYGVQTAWGDGSRVLFDGTSASAPIVAGAIAALMSENAGLTAAQAWSILQTHASDAGPAGTDPAYGNGIVNLGWALGRNDTGRYDTAIASHHFDEAQGTMEILVQNRSASGVTGLSLVIETDGATRTVALPYLAPGAVSVVPQPVDASRLASGASVVFRTKLVNPAGLDDAVPANNTRNSSLTVPPPEG